MAVLSVHISRPAEIFIRRVKALCIAEKPVPHRTLIREVSNNSVGNQIFKMKSVAAIFVLVLATTSALDLPSGFRTCKKSEPKYLQCIGEAVTDAIVSLAGGLKSFKIFPVEPLAVESIKIGEAKGAVNLKQEYKNIKLYGLTKGLNVTNYRIDFDKWILRSDAYNDQVDFVADYKIDGRILVLPVRGSGKSNITMYNLKTETDMYGETYEKDGETYLKVKKYTAKFHPGRVTMKFENLFDGDSLLGEQMNRFINENADLVFKEVQTSYEETFGLVFKKIANDIFSRVPIRKIFLD